MRISIRARAAVNEVQLSDSFTRRIKNTFGPQGAAWLKTLPKVIAHAKQVYRLNIVEIFAHQSLNFTAKATNQHGEECVVKCCMPSIEVIQEIAALNHMQGPGMVRLLAAQEDKGILVLERLTPGMMLSAVKHDVEATKIAASTMAKLWRPITELHHQWKTTQHWFERLDRPSTLPNDFPMQLIDQARAIARDLHRDMGEAVLLHGDLHHFNILSASHTSWLAIDPKGVIGERVYETGAFLRNPLPDIASRANIRKTMAIRIDIFSEKLGFDKQRIRAWGFAQAVLAAVWSLDAHSMDYRAFLVCADAIKSCQSIIYGP